VRRYSERNAGEIFAGTRLYTHFGRTHDVVFEPFAEAKREQHAGGIRRELDAGTDVREFGRFLEHCDVKAGACQRKRRAQTADACTGDDNGSRGSRHGPFLLLKLSRSRRIGLVAPRADRARGRADTALSNRADDLVVAAHVEKNVRMIEWRFRAHAHEFARTNFDLRQARVVVKMRNDMVRHA
jgi:hypothetical protein